jgi:hypothetical protein
LVDIRHSLDLDLHRALESPWWPRPAATYSSRTGRTLPGSTDFAAAGIERIEDVIDRFIQHFFSQARPTTR